MPAPSLLLCALAFLLLLLNDGVSQEEEAVLDSAEQESVYRVLEAVNSGIPWRSLYPDDLCASGPHGVVCDSVDAGGAAVHVTELSFGLVPEDPQKPPCAANATLSPAIFSGFIHLRKLFFYKCFAGSEASTPPPIPASFGSSLEELVFVENPSLSGPLAAMIGNFTRLRRLIVTGARVSGTIPDELGLLSDLEQVTLSRNRISGEVPASLGQLKSLKVLDLSSNGFGGRVPDSIRGLSELVKLDLSSNRLVGEIPGGIGDLQKLEFLDLSHNRFANCGVPLFLAGMPNLREVYLSGNGLGGQIPEIWEKLGGILGLGFSGLGLVGTIPASMGVFLRDLCYLGLDNNRLEGAVPGELGLLGSVKELNLENNRLSGRLPFSAEFTAGVGEKLKIAGNPELCVDEDAKNSRLLGHLKVCTKPLMMHYAVALYQASSSSSTHQTPCKLVLFLGAFVALCLVVMTKVPLVFLDYGFGSM